MPRLPKSSAFLIGLLASVAIFVFMVFNFLLPRIEAAILDQMIYWKDSSSWEGVGSVAVCVVDDRTISEYSRWPLPRSVLADLVSKLHEAGARVIAFDMFFSEPQDTDEDEKLAQAISAAQNVVLGYPLLDDAVDPQRASRNRCVSGISSLSGQWPEIRRMENILPNIEPLAKAARAQGFLVSPRLFGAYQRAWLVLSFNRRHCASLPLVAVKHYFIERAAEEKTLGDNVDMKRRRAPILELARNRDGSAPRIVVGTRRVSAPSSAEPASPSDGRSTKNVQLQQEVRINAEGLIGINYRGSRSLAPHSAVDVIQGAIPDHEFKGKIVFIGSLATGDAQSEVVQTPFGEIPGVVHHAILADNLLRNDYIRDGGYPETLSSYAVLFSLGPLVGMSVVSKRKMLGASLAVLLLVTWPLLCFIVFLNHNLYLNVGAPLGAGLLALLVTLPLASGERPLRGLGGRFSRLIRKWLEQISKLVRPGETELDARIERPGPPQKCKVLFLAANPTGVHQLRLDDEIREIEAKIRAAGYRDTLELVSRWAVRASDLQQALLEHRPHIVHFSGHGTPSAEIILKDRDGRPRPVSQEALVDLLTILKDDIRLVVFNACYSKLQAEAIVGTIDCAVGMKDVVSDEAAIAFAAALYQAIGFGRSIKTAFDLGKNEVSLQGIPEADLPELMSREGVDISQIRLVQLSP